ncbi:MAG: DEAD/DEAH box helicase family protein [Patescibacteria group bacterium]
MKNEPIARIKINELLKESGWDLIKDIHPEYYTGEGFIDYLLLDSRGLPILVLEAKSEKHDPLDGKYQAEKYARAKKCQFIILSNGEEHYFWNIDKETEKPILRFPTKKDLEKLRELPKRKKLSDIPVDTDFIVQSQGNVADKEKRYLRDYQIEGIKSIINAHDNQDKTAYLLEMATGTGKTLLAAAIIKLFLKSGNAQKILFLVDRIELAQQAKQNLEAYLTEYTVCIFKEKKDFASSFNIVIATIQSLEMQANYRKYFSAFEFDLLISDEAHRSIYGSNRVILEYFEAVKLGLTATPKDYLKGIDEKKLADTDPRKLEKRIMRDTYRTFGCESGEPTFRYSLKEAVNHKPPYLVNPRAIDKRTEITTKLLSEQGWSDVFQTEEGLEVKETFRLKDFETKVFSDALNNLMANEFFKSAKKDPLTGEIGKSIIYCIRQKHAEKIAHLLNKYADLYYPGKYKGTFARRITSNVVGSQDLSKKFRNNKLGDTRTVTTVSMMTTGYDCTDLLNVVLMRPIFSPTEFIQIKGRGTRTHTFIDEKTNNKAEKDCFHIIDYFAVCEFFEEKYDYKEPLKLHKGKTKSGTPPIVEPPIIDFPPYFDTKYFFLGSDGLIYEKEEMIGKECMKIDREVYGNRFEESVVKFRQENSHFADAVKEQDFAQAQSLVEEHILDKPEYYFTLENLRKAYSTENNLVDFIKKALGLIKQLPTKYDRLNEEFQRLKLLNPIDFNKLYMIKEIFQNYLLDSEYRGRLDSGDYAVLSDSAHGGTANLGLLSLDDISGVVNYIKENQLIL